MAACGAALHYLISGSLQEIKCQEAFHDSAQANKRGGGKKESISPQTTAFPPSSTKESPQKDGHSFKDRPNDHFISGLFTPGVIDRSPQQQKVNSFGIH